MASFFDSVHVEEWMVDPGSDLSAGPPPPTLAGVLRFRRVQVNGETAMEAADAARTTWLPRVSARTAQTPLGMQPWTVVEAIVCWPNDGSEAGNDEMTRMFDRAIAEIRVFLRAYSRVAEAPLPIVSHETLPVGLLYLSVNSLDRMEDAALGVFFVHMHVRHQPATLSTDKLDGLPRVLAEESDGEPGAVATSLILQAHEALHNRGDYMSTVILSAAAAELQLVLVLSYLLWESGVRPEDAAARITKDVTSIARTELPALVGGDWNDVRVVAWDTDVRKMRNMSVHGLYRPTREDARRSVRGLNALQEFIRDRLVDDRNRTRYPRSAVSILGVPTLTALGKYNGTVRRVTENPSEYKWSWAFAQWNKFARMIDPGTGRPREQGHAERSVVLALLRPGRQPEWWLHDRVVDLCCRAQLTSIGGTRDLEARLTDRALSLDRDAEPEVAALRGATASNTSDDWILPYRVMPLRIAFHTGPRIDPPAAG
jgi:hypothetical protein